MGVKIESRVFLDQEIDQAGVSLASRLEIALVIKSGDEFVLLNSEVSPELQATACRYRVTRGKGEARTGDQRTTMTTQ